MGWKMKLSISRGDSRVEWKIPSFTNEKYFYHCTNESIHYLFYVKQKCKIISKFFLNLKLGKYKTNKYLHEHMYSVKSNKNSPEKAVL